MKYYIGYKYDRIQNIVDVNGESQDVTYSSYSSDELIIDFEIRTLEDIRKVELFLFGKLNKNIPKDQQIISLLLLGIFKLEG